MELYGAGFNAQGQLSSTSCPKDLLRFQKIAEGNRIRIHCAVWNATVLEIDGIIHYRGFNELTGMITNDEISGLPASRIKTVIGSNTNGILGALTRDGEVWLLNALESEHLVFVKHHFPSGGYWANENPETIAHIAIADNEQVSVCTRKYQCALVRIHPLNSTPHIDSGLMAQVTDALSTLPPTQTILVFASFANFLCSRQPTRSYPFNHFKPASILASTTSFTGLFDSFDEQLICTWGDARHSHLGRLPSDSEPAAKPSPLSFLREAQIRKLSTKGWLTAALTKTRDCYIWGGRPGQKECEIAVEPWVEGNVRLIDVDEGADVLDVAVGNGWILVLTASYEIWGWGDCSWGQLGIGKKAEWIGRWKKIKCKEWEGNGKQIVGIECGFWNSFILVKLKQDEA